MLIICGLIVLNGVFSMSELAIVSARPARLRVAAEEGSGAARTALALAANPGKFLSTVQIGITLIGIIAGAYSGASLGGPVAERMERLGLDPRYAEEAGFAVVIAVTTYLSLVIGELVPKQIALRSAAQIAIVMAYPMALLARVAAPLVWLLDQSSEMLLRLLRIRHASHSGVTEEELHMIFAEATRSGVLEEEERAIMAGVMRLADRPVRELMTPRTELDWIEIGEDADELRETITATPHSLLPLCNTSPDEVIGVVKVRELMARMLSGEAFALDEIARKPPIIPDQLDAMDALRILQQSGVAMAMVHDEYGHLEGIVTPSDLLAGIAGHFASHEDEGDAPLLTEREDGSLLISGGLPVDVLAERLALDLPDSREYATAAGFVLSVLRKLPEEGEIFEEQGWRFEVIDMDGHKIDKLLVSRSGVPH